ncbi:MAG TPA: hypothetical protein VNQ90_10940 [Chthoniobacteraceae bacterium]|nr:hypothetical protein [Chthoniobacteraceae bacterium]
MKTGSSSNQRGSVLLVTLALLTIVCALTGVAFNITSNTTHTTVRSRDFAAANAAAEGALEYAYAVWTRRIGRGEFNTKDLAKGLTPPAFEGITFTEDGISLTALDAYGTESANGVAITGRVPGYQGWAGRTRNYAAEARVKMDDGTIVGVRRIFQYTEVPLFQSMFFFQNNLELFLPANMVITGLAHTNGDMYVWSASPNTVTFQSNVTVTGTYHDEAAPQGHYWSSSKGDTGAKWDVGKNGQLSKVPPIMPMGGKPEEVFDAKDNNKNNDGYHEIIEPPYTGHDDPEAIASRRLYNKAGILIEIKTDSDGKHAFTVTAKGDTTLTNSAKSTISSALSKVIGQEKVNEKRDKNNKVIVKAVDPSGIWDAREKAWVDVTTVDVGALTTLLSNTNSGVAGFNKVLYIHDLTSGGNSRKAIRLTNGRILPEGGLTIASENPLYIQGDYNTGQASGKGPKSSTDATPKPENLPGSATVGTYERQPAAVIADAVMFLSNNWKDSNTHEANSKTYLNKNTASNTTYNVAIISGHKPSSEKDEYYSGGANNYPRFLENWSGKYCTYFGSMVELFDSKQFTGNWDTTNIYSPPTRHWNFDTKYLKAPPPGSVEAVVLNRGPWSRFVE